MQAKSSAGNGASALVLNPMGGVNRSPKQRAPVPPQNGEIVLAKFYEILWIFKWRNIGLQFLANGLSLRFPWKAVLFMKSTWKATKTTDSTQISHLDLVFHRVQREGQLGRYYILMVFGGAHACLVVHICVYGACMHTYVWSFVLYNFIVDFIKCNTILLKPKWFHFMRFQTTSWNPTGFYRVTRFHKVHGSLQDYIKSRRISWNLSGFP